MAGSRVVSFLVILVTLRIAFPYLRSERFGVLSTITSLAFFLAFADLGIANSLVSPVARLQAFGNKQGLRELVGSAFVLLCALGAVVFALVGIAASIMPLEWLFKGASGAVLAEARVSLVVFGLLFALSLPLGALQRTFVGLQEGYVPQLLGLPFSVTGLAILIALPALGAGIPLFLIVSYGAQAVSGAPLVFILIRRGLLALPHSARAFGQHARALLSSGGWFVILQMAALIGWFSDTIFISAILGPSATAPYVVVQRMFMFLSVPIAILSAPLWSAYSSAAAKGDWGFVRDTLRRSLTLNLSIALGGGVLLCLISDTVARVLTAGNLVPSRAFVASYATWAVIDAWNAAMASYLNGLHILRLQVVSNLGFVIAATILKLVLLQHIGVTGLPWINVLSYVLMIVVPYCTVFRRRVFAPA